MKIQDEINSFNVIDWQKWMDEHHIKLRGDPRDNRSNEVPVGGGISGTKLETEVPDNARQTNSSDIQKSK